MTSVIGWYGPLVDLSKAESHLGSFVQLLVFVHRTSPLQYKLSNGGELIRTDIQVADNTIPYFSVSIWNKQMGSIIVAGDVILLQNVKIIKFRDVIEARTVQHSSLVCLIHPYESLLSKSVADLVAGSQVGVATKKKLQKVVEWVKQAGSNLHNTKSNSIQSAKQKGQSLRNWKAPAEVAKAFDSISLLEVFGLTKSCMAKISASIGEIFLPITWRALDESEKENMFISRRLTTPGNDKLVEDIICIGCSLCGSPLSVDHSRSMNEQNSVPLNCQRSSNRLHVVSLIYRPFMLYVWDKSAYMPLFVRNKAAEILFGNIKAENINTCYKGKNEDRNTGSKEDHETSTQKARHSNDVRGSRKLVSSGSAYEDKTLGGTGKHSSLKKTNFYLIWMILLRTLLLGKNSPLKFEVTVNSDLDKDSGRVEMISVSIPCSLT